MAVNAMEKLIGFLGQLNASRTYFSLQCHRDAIMVTVPRPDEHREIKFFSDGHVEIQVFGPSGDVFDVSDDELDAMVKDWSE